MAKARPEYLVGIDWPVPLAIPEMVRRCITRPTRPWEGESGMSVVCKEICMYAHPSRKQHVKNVENCETCKKAEHGFLQGACP
eukprot:4748545-Karenia_brevis.AAC.1